VILRDVTIHRATLRVQVCAFVVEVRDDFTSRGVQVLVVLIEIPDDSSGSRVEVPAHIRQCTFVSVVHEGSPFGAGCSALGRVTREPLICLRFDARPGLVTVNALTVTFQCSSHITPTLPSLVGSEVLEARRMAHTAP
jgi:hypothetical protein